jgi:predicted alpha/beta-fold hydrolase
VPNARRRKPKAVPSAMMTEDYIPLSCLRNGHAMTVFTWARPRRFPELPAPEERIFDVAADARVLAKCHWQTRRTESPTLLLLHGLEGSADAHYMRGIAAKAFSAGFNVVRLNQRNCGGTDHLSVGVYNSGLTADPAAVVRQLIDTDRLPSIAVAGYSLGGNLALKLAGEYGPTPPPEVRAVAAVSPTLDLAACIDALERRSNWLYQQNFLLALKQRIRRKHRLFPTHYSVAPLPRVRSVRQFDDAYTAPMSGYRDAADYYYRASSLRVAGRIGLPTLVITAMDDPFVPVEPFRDPAVALNPAIHLLVTPHGGHCGYVSRPADGSAGDPSGNLADDGYWAERMVVEFVRERAGASPA